MMVPGEDIPDLTKLMGQGKPQAKQSGSDIPDLSKLLSDEKKKVHLPNPRLAN